MTTGEAEAWRAGFAAAREAAADLCERVAAMGCIGYAKVRTNMARGIRAIAPEDHGA